MRRAFLSVHDEKLCTKFRTAFHHGHEMDTKNKRFYHQSKDGDIIDGIYQKLIRKI